MDRYNFRERKKPVDYTEEEEEEEENEKGDEKEEEEEEEDEEEIEKKAKKAKKIKTADRPEVEDQGFPENPPLLQCNGQLNVKSSGNRSEMPILVAECRRPSERTPEFNIGRRPRLPKRIENLIYRTENWEPNWSAKLPSLYKKFGRKEREADYEIDESDHRVAHRVPGVKWTAKLMVEQSGLDELRNGSSSVWQDDSHLLDSSLMDWGFGSVSSYSPGSDWGFQFGGGSSHQLKGENSFQGFTNAGMFNNCGSDGSMTSPSFGSGSSQWSDFGVHGWDFHQNMGANSSNGYQSGSTAGPSHQHSFQSNSGNAFQGYMDPGMFNNNGLGGYGGANNGGFGGYGGTSNGGASAMFGSTPSQWTTGFHQQDPWGWNHHQYMPSEAQHNGSVAGPSPYSNPLALQERAHGVQQFENPVPEMDDNRWGHVGNGFYTGNPFHPRPEPQPETEQPPVFFPEVEEHENAENRQNPEQ